MDTLRETQETLETRWATEGHLTYKQRFTAVPFSSSDIGSYIMGKSMTDLERNLTEYFSGVTRWQHDALYAIWHTVPVAELATVVLRFLMDKVFSGHPGFRKASKTSNCMSSLSIQLGGTLMSHFNWYAFRKRNEKSVKHFEEFLKDKSKLYRRRTLKWYKKVLKHEDLSIPTADKASLGYPFLRTAIESTGLFEVVERSVGTRRMTMVVPSAVVINNIMGKLETLSWMHPLKLPMVCPPTPWTDWNAGGYLTLEHSVITHHRDTARKLMANGHLTSRFECLNRLQSVAWEINKDILNIALAAYHSNHYAVPVCDLGVEMPPRPWNDRKGFLWLKANKPEVIKEWNQRAATIMNEFYGNRTKGQRLTFLRCLSIAKDYSAYDALWFPWRMDYRGRFYPIPTTLNPQGDDMARALLMFKTRTPLTPADTMGWRWYLIQGANLMGVDKVSFDDRVSWIRQRHNEILRSAADPLHTSWWTEADKPWNMLAWCTEYSRIVSGAQSYTQIPVNLDGRCNGLQHLATAVRDEKTAALVSLVPADKPADIYTTVLKAVESVVPEDSYWNGKLKRSLVKRNIMTTPYNVTREGMKNQLLSEMLSESEFNKLTKEDKHRAVELRNYNHDTITGLLGVTTELMRWYTTVAREYTKRGLVMSWVLPDNFRVIQDIPKTKTKKLRLESSTVVINYRVNLDKQEPRRNHSAFSPNVTHSMDATHMAMWLRSIPPDVPIAAIHDSFGMPSPKVHPIGGTIVNKFVDLYESFDVITAIQEDFRLKTGEELPPPPTRGNLDITKIRESIYAFA
jgi:DNA-directed RNA polymerase, mitochondrial